MNEYLIQIISGALGAVGYSVLFNIRRDKLIFAGVGGALTWLVYLLIFQVNKNLFVCNMIAAAFATFYSEILARIKKAPTTCFLIPSVMPLIPGGGLYYTMSAVIEEDGELFEHYFVNTVSAAFGISIGIMFMSLIGVRLVKVGIAPIRTAKQG